MTMEVKSKTFEKELQKQRTDFSLSQTFCFLVSHILLNVAS